jgi:hypothetical protein
VSKPSRRAWVATLTGIAVAAAASYGSVAAAADVDTATSAPPPHIVAMQSSRADARAPRSAAPLTLHLEDASGNAVRLVHLPGVGWHFDRVARGPGSPLKKTALQTATPASSGGGDDVPLTVFIDGPSGFTYVWNRDDGWKCVGRLVDDAL